MLAGFGPGQLRFWNTDIAFPHFAFRLTGRFGWCDVCDMAEVVVDDKYLDRRILKEFRDRPLEEVPGLPVHALKGLSEGDEKLLNESFYVKTVRDLAELKYVVWAQELVVLARMPQSKINMDLLKDKLIKKYETTPVKKILQSPVSALQGVSAADKNRLGKAFNVKTVSQFARLKYAKWAQEICAAVDGDFDGVSAAASAAGAAALGAAGLAASGLADGSDAAESSTASAYAPGESVSRSGDSADSSGSKWWRILLLILLIALILFAIWYFFRGCADAKGQQGAADESAQPRVEQVEENAAAGDAAGNADAGGVNDSVATDTPAPTPVTAGTDLQPGQDYAIQSGDTLYKLSRRAYGTPRKWRKIFDANRALIKDPDLLQTGRSVRIP